MDFTQIAKAFKMGISGVDQQLKARGGGGGGGVNTIFLVFTYATELLKTNK